MKICTIMFTGCPMMRGAAVRRYSPEKPLLATRFTTVHDLEEKEIPPAILVPRPFKSQQMARQPSYDL